jgi:hypothetical protein
MLRVSAFPLIIGGVATALCASFLQASPAYASQTQMQKSGNQEWANLNGWQDITSWSAVSGAKLGDNNTSLIAPQTEAGATLSATAQIVHAKPNTSWAVRIVRAANNAVIATGQPVTGDPSRATVTTTADVVAGEQFKVQISEVGGDASSGYVAGGDATTLSIS